MNRDMDAQIPSLMPGDARGWRAHEEKEDYFAWFDTLGFPDVKDVKNVHVARGPVAST
jgi:hypothetical protein